MAPTHVQSLGTVSSAVAAQTTTVISVASLTVTAGNTIIVGWGNYHNITPTGVTDNLGNTYTRAERTTRAESTSDLWYAPVTSAGTLTTITVAHPSTQYRSAVAAEFSPSTFVEVGGGLTGVSTGPATWTNNKSIPAGGLTVGFVTTNAAVAHGPGSASGTPSTSIAESGEITNGAAVSASLAYALDTAEAGVTGFSGTTTVASSTAWAGAGGIFAPVITGPVWVSPADTASMGTTPVLEFTSPVSASAQHFQIQLDTADTFDTGNLRDLRTDLSQTGWEYWDGDSWEAFPSTGLAAGVSGNDVRHTVQSALSATTWYRRVRAGV